MYGTLMHGLIHSYYLQRQNGEVNVESLHEAIDTQWRSEGFVSKGQEERRKQQAHATLDAFIERQKDQSDAPTRMEMPFEFEVPDQKVRIRGRMDAVVEGDLGVEIRDYKTSQEDDPKKANKKAKDSLQLATYALAWKSMMGKLPDQTTLDYVETGVRGTFTPTDKSMEELMQKTQQVAEGIRSGNYTPSGNHFYCVHRKIQGGQDGS
jgi:DNA helicase-2/ATP-dependent DNA helicase PcrA